MKNSLILEIVNNHISISTVYFTAIIILVLSFITGLIITIKDKKNKKNPIAQVETATTEKITNIEKPTMGIRKDPITNNAIETITKEEKIEEIEIL